MRFNFRILIACGLVGLPLTVSAGGGTISGKVEITAAKYLPETVVYLKGAPKTQEGPTAIMNQKKLQFVPHLLLITQEEKVEFHSEDPVIHNVYARLMNPSSVLFNIGLPPHAAPITKTFSQAGIVRLSCNV